MVEDVQVSQIKKLYPNLKGVLERPSRNIQREGLDEQEPTSMHETIYPECEFSIHFTMFTGQHIPVKSLTPYCVAPVN